MIERNLAVFEIPSLKQKQIVTNTDFNRIPHIHICAAYMSLGFAFNNNPSLSVTFDPNISMF